MGFKKRNQLERLKPMPQQAPENTLESLIHGMSLFDAIEFDIRLTVDEQVVIHHDREVSVSPSKRENRSQFVEDWTLDELTELGFCSFESLLAHPTIQESVHERGKVLVVESKRPSLKHKRSGGLLNKKKHDAHMGKTMKLAESLLDQYEIPKRSTVHYAFHKSMKNAVRIGRIERDWSTLLPTVHPFAGRKIQRMFAFPEYAATSFARLMRKHQKNGSPMMPCAIEYILPPTNLVHFGRTVGLKGRRLRKLTAIRKGFPVYLWPVLPKIEHSVLDAGLSALTDESNPELTWLPSGHARWTQPATRPLDEAQQRQLNNATKETHVDVVKSLKKDTQPWTECDSSRKRELLAYWRKKWQWSKSVDELVRFEKQHGSMPWEVVRMIGHRGSGKTKRPVL